MRYAIPSEIVFVAKRKVFRVSASTSRAWLEHYSDWTPHTLDYGDKTIVDYYRDNLRANANKSATYFFGRTQTYAELDAQVRAAAAGLKAFGIRPGDKVAIVLPNCPQHVAAFYAVQLLDATVVEHNPLYTAPELEGLLNDHGARVAISWDKTASTLEKLRSTTPLETIVSVNMVEAMPPAQAPRAAPAHPASGRQARAAHQPRAQYRGVVHPHRLGHRRRWLGSRCP